MRTAKGERRGSAARVGSCLALTAALVVGATPVFGQSMPWHRDRDENRHEDEEDLYDGSDDERGLGKLTDLVNRQLHDRSLFLRRG